MRLDKLSLLIVSIVATWIGGSCLLSPRAWAADSTEPKMDSKSGSKTEKMGKPDPIDKKDAPKDAPKEPAVKKPATAKELEHELDDIEAVIARENRRHETQVAVIRRSRTNQVSTGGGKESDEEFANAMNEEKSRHEDRVKELGDRWLEIKTELDARKAEETAEKK